MLEWLYEGGARFKKLGVHAQSTNERCVMSTAKIEKKEIVLFVPLRRMITIELAQTSPTMRTVANRRM